MADASREASYWSQDVSALAAAFGAGLVASPRMARQLTAVVVIVGGYILATEVGKAWVFRGEEALLSPSPVSKPGGRH